MPGINTPGFTNRRRLVQSGTAQLPPGLSHLQFAQGGEVPQQPGMTASGPQMAGGSQMGGENPEVIENEAQRIANANPEVIQQLQQVIMQALQTGKLTMEQLNMAVQLAKAAAQNPELYPRLRQMAIQNGLATEQSLPPTFEPGLVFAFVLAGQAVQQMQGGQQMGQMGGQPQMQPGMEGMQQQLQQPQMPQQGQPQQQMPAYARGGLTPGASGSQGGPTHGSPSGDRTGRKDDIPIWVSGGEYVIPKHIVQSKGTEYFDRLLEKYNGGNK